MKNLRFLSCRLVSHRERRALHVEFDPMATVFKGQNDTGKSSVAKSLFKAFGADAAVEHPSWTNARVSLLLDFLIDDKTYTLLQTATTYALFSGSDFLGKFDSITNGLGPALTKLLSFGLKLPNREGNLVPAPPAYMLLPFYCDQDAGWTATWSSFKRLSQFSRWREEVIPYHMGMRSAAYYDALELKTIAAKERDERQTELSVLQRLHERTGIDTLLDAEIDPELFRTDISDLVAKYEELSRQRERYRNKISELSERKVQLKAQLEVLTRVRRELHEDYVFAVDTLDADFVECPTCGQQHTNDFSERFAIAQDESRALDMLQEITEDLAAVAKQKEDEDKLLLATDEAAISVQEVLARKRGSVTFNDIVQRRGLDEFNSMLKARLKEIERSIDELNGKIKRASEAMKKAENQEQKYVALSKYRNLMHQYLKALDVKTLTEKEYEKPTFVLKETGSDRPRAILAYMFSILELIWDSDNTPRCPIVLDSPMQQDQDDANHLKMLTFIRDFRPTNSQLVLCVVDDCGLDFGGKVIEFSRKNLALEQDSYSEIAEHFRPYEAALFEGLN